MQEDRVCIVILNWNNWKNTIECLGSLSCIAEQDVTNIIVVDNASTDNSVGRILEWVQNKHEFAPSLSITPGANLNDETLRTFTPKFLLVRTDKNRGYASGNNIGIQLALKYFDCSFIWILNNDTVVDRNALPSLLECALRKPDVGIWGSTIVEYHHPDIVQCAGGGYYNPLLTLNRFVFRKAKLDVALDSRDKIHFHYIAGSALFMKVAMIRKVGLLSEDYFLYYEEIDYAVRARRYGYHLGWCRKSIVLHKGGASSGSRTKYNKKKSKDSEYHCNVSVLKYTRKFHPFLFPLVLILRFLLKALHHFSYGNFYLFKPLVRAYRDYIFSKYSREHYRELE
jgi:GT2 family glycosyltransferase